MRVSVPLFLCSYQRSSCVSRYRDRRILALQRNYYEMERMIELLFDDDSRFRGVAGRANSLVELRRDLERLRTLEKEREGRE